jgi:hypothetical protein
MQHQYDEKGKPIMLVGCVNSFNSIIKEACLAVENQVIGCIT